METSIGSIMVFLCRGLIYKSLEVKLRKKLRNDQTW